MARLHADSQTPVVVRFSNQQLRFASFDVEAPGAKDDSAAQQAMAFLERYADLFGIVTPRADPVREPACPQCGRRSCLLRSACRPHPVFGAQLAVHLRGSRIVATNGDYVPGTLPPAEAALTAAQKSAIT